MSTPTIILPTRQRESLGRLKFFLDRYCELHHPHIPKPTSCAYAVDESGIYESVTLIGGDLSPNEGFFLNTAVEMWNREASQGKFDAWKTSNDLPAQIEREIAEITERMNKEFPR